MVRPQKYPDLKGQVFRALKKAAQVGAPCPTNAALRDLFDLPSTNSIVLAMHELRAGGAISVERGSNWRRVKIEPDGLITSNTGRRRHYQRRTQRCSECGKLIVV